MSEMNDIDDLLRDKLQDQEFPFDEQNWEKARDLIDASRRRRKGLLILFPLIGLSLAVATVWLYSTYSGTSGNLATAPETTTQATAENKNQQQSSQPVTHPSAEHETTPVASSLTQSDASQAATSDETLAKEKQNHDAKTSPDLKTEALTETHTAIEQAETSKANQHIQQTQHETEKTANTHATLKAVTSVNPDKRTQQPAENSVTAMAANNTTATQNTKAVRNHKQSKHPVENSETNAVTQTSAAKQTQPSHQKSANETSFTEEPLVSLASTDTQKEDVYMLTPVWITFTDAPADADISVFNLSAVPESTAGKELPANQGPRHTVYADAGMSYLLGWNNGMKREGDGFNLTGGFTYQYIARAKLGVSLGLQYNSVGHLINSSYVASDTRYGFGKEQVITVIEQKQLYYITMPVRFIVAPGHGNYFGIGCNFSYLLNSNNIVKKYEFDNAQQPSGAPPILTFSGNTSNAYALQNPVSSTNTRGYRKGFNPYDMQVGLFYRRTVYKRLSVGAEVFYGLMDIKQNSFFNSTYFDRNSGFKLSLGLNLFSK